MALRTERVSVAALVLDGCGVCWLQAVTWHSSARNNCTITRNYTGIRRVRREQKRLSMELKWCTEVRTQTHAFRKTDDNAAAGTFPPSICPCYKFHSSFPPGCKQAACTHRCSKIASSHCVCTVLHPTLYMSQFDMHVRKRQHIRQSELSYALRRSLIFLQKMVSNSRFTTSTTNRGQ